MKMHSCLITPHGRRFGCLLEYTCIRRRHYTVVSRMDPTLLIQRGVPVSVGEEGFRHITL